MAVVVAAVGALGDGEPAELACPEDDRLVEQPALLEVADQGRGGLVGPGTQRLERLGVLAVGVPGLAAQEELDKADAPLDQAAGDQAASAVLVGGRVVQAIHPPDRRRLAGQVDGLGDGGLHLRGDLEIGDPRLELGIAGMAAPGGPGSARRGIGAGSRGPRA